MVCNKIRTKAPAPLNPQIVRSSRCSFKSLVRAKACPERSRTGDGRFFGRTLEQRWRGAAPAPDRPRLGRDPRAGGVLAIGAMRALSSTASPSCSRSACTGWRWATRISTACPERSRTGSRRAAARPAARGRGGQARSARRTAARSGRSRPGAGGGADAPTASSWATPETAAITKSRTTPPRRRRGIGRSAGGRAGDRGDAARDRRALTAARDHRNRARFRRER